MNTVEAKSYFNGEYKSLKIKVSEILTKVGDDSIKHRDVKQKIEVFKKRLQTLDKKFQEDIDFLDKHVVWDKLTIAFFGETNAGKSTIIETLRIIFDEKIRRAQIDARKKIVNQQWEGYKYEKTKVITSIQTIGDQKNRELEQQSNHYEQEKKTAILAINHYEDKLRGQLDRQNIEFNDKKAQLIKDLQKAIKSEEAQIERTRNPWYNGIFNFFKSVIGKQKSYYDVDTNTLELLIKVLEQVETSAFPLPEIPNATKLNSNLSRLQSIHQEITDKSKELELQEIQLKNIKANIESDIYLNELNLTDITLINNIKNIQRKFENIQQLQKEILDLRIEDRIQAIEKNIFEEITNENLKHINSQISSLKTSFETIKYAESKAEFVDGKIIGTGQADFTKDNTEYELLCEGKNFLLIDVPGIEGQESKYEGLIEKAVTKAHIVFYVNADKKPEKGTAEKIKKYLKDDSTVYAIFNVKANADTYEEAQDRISLSRTHREVDSIVKETENTLKSILEPHHYKGIIPTQALMAFCGLANIEEDNLSDEANKNLKKLIKTQKNLIQAFENDRDKMVNFSQIELVKQIITERVPNYQRDIINSNKEKLVSRISDLHHHLIEYMNGEYSQKFIQEVNNEFNTYKSGVKQDYDTFESSVKRETKNKIEKFFNDITNNVFQVIDEEIKGKQATNEIDRRNSASEIIFKRSLRKIITDNLETLKEKEEHRRNKLKTYLRSLQEHKHIDANPSVTLNLDNALSAMDISFGDVGGFLGTVGSLALAGSFAGPIGAAIGGAVGLAVVWVKSIFGDGGKGEAKRKAKEAIDKVKYETSDKILSNVQRTCGEVKRSLKQQFEELDKELNTIKDMRNRLDIMQKEVKELENKTKNAVL
jgi:hypothetical protein